MDESEARNEDELQLCMRDHPELLPVEELHIGGSMLVVGRETHLPSGRPDLLALSDTGDLVIVEMKTGPANSDFRRALAQLIDYGSDLWQTSLEEFEGRHLVPYLQGSQCPEGAPGRGCGSLTDALVDWLGDDSEPGVADIIDQLRRDLADGAFTYVLAAQSLTTQMERAIEYLNATMSEARFYAVELVKFHSRDRTGLVAFEGRTAVGPTPQKIQQSESAKSDKMLTRFPTELRPVVSTLLETAQELGLVRYFGDVGASLKMHVPERETPVSVAWLYPPGRNGLGGSAELTLGATTKQLDELAESRSRLDAYLQAVQGLAVGEPIAKAVQGVVVPWTNVDPQVPAIHELLAQLMGSPSDR